MRGAFQKADKILLGMVHVSMLLRALLRVRPGVGSVSEAKESDGNGSESGCHHG